MAITTQISEDGRVFTISISGRFDITAYKDFGESSKNKVESVSKWIVDMAEVEYVDSSALGMLLMLRERAGGDKADINIVNLNSDLKKIFTTANFHKLFSIEE